MKKAKILKKNLNIKNLDNYFNIYKYIIIKDNFNENNINTENNVNILVNKLTCENLNKKNLIKKIVNEFKFPLTLNFIKNEHDFQKIYDKRQENSFYFLKDKNFYYFNKFVELKKNINNKLEIKSLNLISYKFNYNLIKYNKLSLKDNL